MDKGVFPALAIETYGMRITSMNWEAEGKDGVG